MNEEFNPYKQNEQQTVSVNPQQYGQQYQQPQYYQQYEQPYQQPQYEQPYEQSYQQQYQQPQYEQPYEQQYQQQQYQQPQYYQQYEQPSQNMQYPQYPQNNSYPYYSQQAYVQPQRGSAIAKVFAILAFVLGCVSLVSALSSVFSFFMLNQYNDVTYSSPIYAISSAFSLELFTALPGIIFGIIALAKKTKLVPMAVIGLAFCGIHTALAIIGTFIY